MTIEQTKGGTEMKTRSVKEIGRAIEEALKTYEWASREVKDLEAEFWDAVQAEGRG